MRPPSPNPAPTSDVLPVSALAEGALQALLAPYGLVIESATGAIPGSYWGESEAGLIGNRLILRRDTPVHSALHEACHFICLQNRDAHLSKKGTQTFGKGVRPLLHTDAGGDDLEECAVCYLQIVLAERLTGYSRERMFTDMDAWGYSFRLGSARAWFERDSGDAQEWLAQRTLLPASSAR
ncbi:MAG: hypothetical protein ACRETF_01710 [Nevskiaceae bacterium]